MKKSSKTLSILLVLWILSILVMSNVFAADAGDPTGTSYNVISGSETLADVAATANQAYFGSNFVWVMIAGFMVFFFQCGFAMVETGFCRGKNAAHIMTMNFMVFLVGAIGYFLVGFALQMGGSGGAAGLGSGGTVLDSLLVIPGIGGIVGYKGFALSGTYDVGIYALFFFQMVFMDTTVTIPTGALAERVKYSAVVITSFFISMFLYPLFANWVWGGGWLATLGKNFGIGHGVVDFAGSAVVHTMGGMIALSGAIVLGPRIGKFRKDGTARAIPGHNIPMAIVGTIILFFCWFSFNAGSTLNASDLRLAVVATNTMIAGAVGGLVSMFYCWIKYGKPDPSMTANGALAGLVAITAPCAFVNGISSFLIGFIAGILVCVAVPFIENKLKIDDPVGAISVHCVNGLWGVLALGLFADGTYGDGFNGVSGGVTGLLFGDASQLLAQLICVLILIVWGFGVSYLFFIGLDKVWGLRVSPEDELEGLDIPEMGVLAYPDSPMVRTELDFDSSNNAVIKQLARFNKKEVIEKIYPTAAVLGVATSAELLPGNGGTRKMVSVDQAIPVVTIPEATSDTKITRVSIILNQNKFEALKHAMNEIGVAGMTVIEVLGCGTQKGIREYYRGQTVDITLLPKVQVDIIIAKVPVRTVIDTTKQVLYTGNIGDGKMFISTIDNVVKIRTGEEGYNALQYED